jgi:hypothetical protein
VQYSSIRQPNLGNGVLLEILYPGWGKSEFLFFYFYFLRSPGPRSFYFFNAAPLFS